MAHNNYGATVKELREDVHRIREKLLIARSEKRAWHTQATKAKAEATMYREIAERLTEREPDILEREVERYREVHGVPYAPPK